MSPGINGDRSIVKIKRVERLVGGVALKRVTRPRVADNSDQAANLLPENEPSRR